MKRYTLFATALAALSGCAVLPPVPIAVADLSPTQGSTVNGTVTFVERSGKLMVDGHFKGLAPGQHGIHIHEKGDCSAGDGMSAGGPFNPLGKPHADPSTKDRHAGDMPMLVAGAAGNAELTVELDVITVGAGVTDVVGKSIIVHKDPDDFKTQPTGNSGARVACGVIRRA